MAADPENFAPVFDRLRSILMPYASKMIVVKDNPTDYYLDTHHVMPNKKPLFFAAVRMGKGYVSFHLMPLYVTPALSADLSPGLMRRKQGKACFNFKSLDETLFTELAHLTRQGFESYRRAGQV